MCHQTVTAMLREYALFDVDGTVMLRTTHDISQLISKDQLRSAGFTTDRFALVTNSGTKTAHDVRESLRAGFGDDVASLHVLTARDDLEERASQRRGLEAAFAVAGVLPRPLITLPLLRMDDAVRAVHENRAHRCTVYFFVDVASEVPVEQLQAASLLASQGAMLHFSAEDMALPTFSAGHRIMVPGPGLLVTFFKQVLGKTCFDAQAQVSGKPKPQFVRKAIRLLGEHVNPNQVVVVGDNVETDIRGGCGVGAATLLVETGCYSPGMPFSVRPSAVSASLSVALEACQTTSESSLIGSYVMSRADTMVRTALDVNVALESRVDNLFASVHSVLSRIPLRRLGLPRRTESCPASLDSLNSGPARRSCEDHRMCQN